MCIDQERIAFCRCIVHGKPARVIDLVLLAIIGVSALLGLIRGFVGILVSTAAWLLAGLASFQFGDDAALWLSEAARPNASELFGGYALVFIGVMLGVGLTGMVIKSMVRASQLSGMDRALGFCLGLLRGAVVACVLVLLLGFTPLPREASWQQSQVMPLLKPGANWMRARLPHWSLPGLPVTGTDFRNALPTGDNGGAFGEAAPVLEGAMQQVVDSAADRFSRRDQEHDATSTQPAGEAVNVGTRGVDPANIEAAPLGPTPADPANIEPATQHANGRPRPASN